jgi:hypothetical protein
MYAIEFETDAHNGVIRIPQEYQAEFTTHIRVIVLKETARIRKPSKNVSDIEQAMGFDRIAIDTTQWTFRRSEIYERG